MKEQKKVNPYAKKAARKKIRITRTHWIVGICVLAVIATLVCFNLFRDPHAGHDHGDTSTGEHYEGDGHNHSHDGETNTNTNTNTNTTAKVKYQIYTNADKTYRLVIRDQKSAIAFEADNLPKAPIKETIDEANGIYELGWATGSGATEYECVYYNEKTGQISKQFHAPAGTDGVRIAYADESETKILVQDLFDNNGYHKEHTLENAYSKNGTTIISGKLQADKKTVMTSYYINEKGETGHVSINLYE